MSVASTRTTATRLATKPSLPGARRRWLCQALPDSDSLEREPRGCIVGEAKPAVGCRSRVKTVIEGPAHKLPEPQLWSALWLRLSGKLGNVERPVPRLLGLVPNALTAIRPIIGIASGFAVLTDNGATGAWLYLAGYVSDVADGFLSRAMKADSDLGAALDKWADVAFHAAVGLGLTAAAIRDGPWGVLIVLGILVVGERLVRHWIAAHSVGGKVIGGTYRIVMFALLLVFCNVEQRPALIEVALAVMLITYAYEGLVTLHELHTGERPVR
jgi:phosphatidylglycerophosphate synthase